MKAIIFVTCFVTSLICRAQVHTDTALSTLLNDYRHKHDLQALTWDDNICKEALTEFLYEDSIADGDSLISVDSIKEHEIEPFAGLYGEYISGSYLFDGDFAAIPDIDSLIFNDIINNAGERSLLVRPRATKIACLIATRSRYFRNPAKQSRVKRFQIWYITIIIGVSY